MAGSRAVLVAGSALAGTAATLLLGPADALFAASEPGLSGTTDGAAASATPTAAPNSKAKPAATKQPTAKPRTSTAAAQTSSPAKSAKPKSATNTFTGTAAIAGGRYGTMKLTIKVQNGQLTAIDYSNTTVNDGRSQQINLNALPALVQEALASQSAQVSSISGASYTSQAFQTALQNALTKAGN